MTVTTPDAGRGKTSSALAVGIDAGSDARARALRAVAAAARQNLGNLVMGAARPFEDGDVLMFGWGSGLIETSPGAHAKSG